MDEIVRNLHQHFENATAQFRSDSVHQARILTEHYLQQIAEIAAERDAIQQAREEEEEEAVERYDELEAEKVELEEQNEELEREKEEWEEEKEELETQNQALEREKRHWQKKEKHLRQRVEELERLRLDDQKKSEEHLQRLSKAFTQQRDFFSAYKLKSEAQQRQYTVALKDRINAVQRFAPPPILPAEVLANIACFVAGANDYGTLDSFSSTSRLMQRELESTLHETVVWNDTLAKRMRACKADGVYPDDWKYTRFIIIDRPHWQRFARSHEDAAFPNLRASIIKDMDPRTTYASREAAPRYTAELRVKKHLTLTCLSSILQHSLNSQLRPDGESYQGHCTERDLFKPTEGALFAVKFESANGLHARNADQVEACVQVISHFVLPPDPGNIAPRKQKLAITCNQRLDLEVWIRQLPHLVRLNPNLCPQIRLCIQDEMTPHEFIGYAHGFSRLYQTLWLDVFHQRDDHRDTAFVLFEFLVFTSGYRKEENFAAFFTRLPERTGFHGTLEEYPLAPENNENGPAPDIIVLEEDQYMPLQPLTAGGGIGEANRDENDRGHESDGSDLTSLPSDDDMSN